MSDEAPPRKKARTEGPEPRVLAILGLGNPEGVGRRERHSLGARIVAALLAEAESVEKVESDCPDLVGAQWLDFGEVRALVLQPQRPINDSGPQLLAALSSLNQESAPFLAVVDDCWLPLGSIRFREKGSSGGHKGLEGIESAFSCKQAYHRLRVGIGGKNSKEFVTGAFTESEEEKLKPVLTAAVRAVQAWLQMGPEAAQRIMSIVNAQSFVQNPVLPVVTSKKSGPVAAASKTEA
ncbi:pth [Symbiodinium natans]|uniref:Pth protein n=1 Tax=Symbiodinium natans TaxID=878477 RepID=A0A812KG98_9DINO|nr:pth [Symbiodinium natans]